MKLSKKTAIVTGAASGIGKAIAIQFAREGAHVIVVDVSEKGRDTVQEISKLDRTSLFYKADIRFEEEVKEMVQRVNKSFDSIDILVNNAGISIRKNILEAKEEDWNKTIDTNLKGAWLCCKYVIPKMIENTTGGTVINVSSTHSFRTQPSHFPYQSTKAGMIAMTNGICVDYGYKGIRANSISPGFIETPLAENYLKNFPNQEEKIANLVSVHPSGRLGKPKDVANAAVFLASDEANFINGINLIVDGGRSVLQT